MDISHLRHCQATPHWQKIGPHHHHGIAIPLFSLCTANSSGIGEFYDLLPLIDWAHVIGLDVIQLLPLNDTGEETSPYSALSAFALNPLYLQLSALPGIDKFSILQDLLKKLALLNKTKNVQYAAVRSQKQEFLTTYYTLMGQKLQQNEKYQFFLNSTPWLKGYAVFKILKKLYLGASWERWPESQNPINDELFDQIIESEKELYQELCITQFLCDMQLQEVKKYSTLKNVFIMGDVPILIARDSADVWEHRQIFDLNYSAGAPPDVYAKDGQNWGFPIYNWSILEKQEYRWWIERLQWATRYYHMYRIDHIVGFFRIWAIPKGNSSQDGHFIPHDKNEWIALGEKILKMMLSNCEMLPIGEDLGVVPDEVRACLKRLGICGTRVMRWERRWNQDKKYIMPQNYNFDSLATVSTHDSQTLQQWWRDCPEEAKLWAEMEGWTYQNMLSASQHRKILWDSHHCGSLFHVNLLPEYLTLLPEYCDNNIDEQRINVPGVVTDTNWSYRLPLPFEEIAQNDSLRHLMIELIT